MKRKIRINIINNETRSPICLDINEQATNYKGKTEKSYQKLEQAISNLEEVQCERCKQQPKCIDSNICTYCKQLWSITFIDSSVFRLKDQVMTNQSAKKQVNQKTHLYYALFQFNKNFTNSHHFDDIETLQIVRQQQHKEKLLCPKVLEEEILEAMQMQNLAIYKNLDVDGQDDIQIICTENIKKGTFLFNFAGDASITKKQGHQTLRIDGEIRSNISLFLSVAKEVQKKLINVEVKQFYITKQIYLCFFAQRDLQEKEYLFVEDNQIFEKKLSNIQAVNLLLENK